MGVFDLRDLFILIQRIGKDFTSALDATGTHLEISYGKPLASFCCSKQCVRNPYTLFDMFVI